MKLLKELKENYIEDPKTYTTDLQDEIWRTFGKLGDAKRTAALKKFNMKKLDDILDFDMEDLEHFLKYLMKLEDIKEGDDKNMDDVKENHPEVYNFLKKLLGYMALDKNSTVSTHTSKSGVHEVRITIQPSADPGNLQLSLNDAKVKFQEPRKDLFAGRLNKLTNWVVSVDGPKGNRKENWIFSISKEGGEQVRWHDE